MMLWLQYDNQITDEGVHALCEWLRVNTSLWRLWLVSCQSCGVFWLHILIILLLHVVSEFCYFVLLRFLFHFCSPSV